VDVRFSRSRHALFGLALGLRFLMAVEDEDAVTQRSIEMVIGRLLTDEEFRDTFLSNPHRALSELLERGTQLTHAEIAALVGIDAGLWGRVADEIDPRLQKASLKSTATD
jgi:hypothetical protein